jgi:hypothetical protein
MRNLPTDDIAVGRLGGTLRKNIGFQWNPFHRSLPAITTPSERFNEAGILGGVAQRLTQPVHGGTDAMFELHDRVIWPKPLAQVFPQDEFAGVLQQGG